MASGVLMPLHVHTAQIRYCKAKMPDAIDITRKSAQPEWLFLAPSWAILGPALEARKRADALLKETYGLDPTARSVADQWMYAAWEEYVPAFMAEMRTSWKEHRPMWDVLLSRQCVILCCYCSDAEHCHRAILRQDILPKLGAIDCGELELSAYPARTKKETAKAVGAA